MSPKIKSIEQKGTGKSKGEMNFFKRNINFSTIESGFFELRIRWLSISGNRGRRGLWNDAMLLIA